MWTINDSNLNSSYIPAKAGIYKITNVITEEIYIGSSSNLRKRFVSHRALLERNKHFNSHLQLSYNKNTGCSFIFSIILFCDPSFLLWYEQKIIDIFKPKFNKRGVDVASNLGIKFSEEHNEKVRKSRIGSKHSNLSRLRMSISKMGHKPYHCKTYTNLTFISPDGEEYKNVVNLRHFCKLHSLEAKHFVSVVTGKRNRYRGWRVETNELAN